METLLPIRNLSLAAKLCPLRRVMIAFLLVAVTSGCSVKRFAINKLGDSLANSGTTFASDNDPELVGSALPFSLKLIEGLLAESPKHRGLLFAASSGFTQYAYVYVQQPAEETESKDFAAAQALRSRARNLYLRGRDFGMRGLEAKHPGFQSAVREHPATAVRKLRKSDVPLMYWSAVSWGAAIAISKNNPEIIADQRVVEAIIDRALELDPDYDNGSIHGFLITYELARQGVPGDFAVRSRAHFKKAVELTNGQLAAPYLALAETVCVQQQDRAEFESLLGKALAVDVDVRPEWRLNNLVMQRRAHWLLSRVDDLFADGGTTTSQVLAVPKVW